VEAEEKATHTSRTQADAALTEISRHLALAPNEKARAACAQIAAGLAPGAPAPSWPEPPVLPDPAAQPWEALAAAADVAEAFCGLAQAVGETVARWRSQWEARQLSAFEELRARAARAEKARSEAADGHRAYLAAEADSGRLAQARADAALALGLLERARREAQEAHQALQAAQAAYDAQAHARARTELEESAGRVSALERDVARDAAQLDDARRRAERLKLAQEQWRQESQRKALLEGRRDVLEHLRRALRDAGPLVAEHLVQAVNLRARKIYAALSPHDPGQLDWQADYELRVGTTSGVRRFATLSGGQKVKAALALQLALVQQFSQAGICIFDEPTYALDAESRALLAEAIVEAQKVSRFEQLFIVSHDDAFDNLVEHTVVLEYSPASGTRLA
jgi:exonuclease SbcC